MTQPPHRGRPRLASVASFFLLLAATAPQTARALPDPASLADGGVRSATLRLPPSVSKEAQRAYRMLLEDHIFAARDAADELLEQRAHDAESLTLAGVVQIFLLDLPRATRFLDQAVQKEPGSAQVHLRRGDLELALSNFKEAEKEYQQSAQLDPKRPLAYLNLAASLLQDQKVEAARAILARVARMGALDREELLTRAMVLFLSGDAAGASADVQDSEKAEGPNATTLFIRAMLDLKAGQLADAQRLLSKAADLGLENPSLLYQIANLMVALNNVTQAHAMLQRALETFPHCAKLHEQMDEIDKRFRSLARMETKHVDPFEVRFDAGLDVTAVDRVVSQFQTAYTALAHETGLRPRPVTLAIYSTTGFSSPAYYNNLTGEVTISGEFFTQGGRHLSEFVQHAVVHEMAHLFVWHGHQGTTRAIHCLWIDEGLAENVAGGIDYIRHMSVDVPELFSDGPLSMSDLIGNINILWHDNKKNLKAYLQSYFMVAYLMRRGGGGSQGFDRVARLLKMVAQDVPLTEGLRTVFGISAADFDQGWRAYLRDHLKG